MKRSWLIGAALLLSLSAVACSDDNEDHGDGSVVHNDGGHFDGGAKDASIGPSMDSSVDASIDATVPVGDAGHDGGDAH